VSFPALEGAVLDQPGDAQECRAGAVDQEADHATQTVRWSGVQERNMPGVLGDEDGAHHMVQDYVESDPKRLDLPAGESVVVVPAAVQETYFQLGAEEFGRLFESFELEAFRLETLEAYDVEDEKEEFKRFLAG
jgi:hypothetical protein